jgi:hypothetical protein
MATQKSGVNPSTLFLQYARLDPVAQQGTVASGSGAGVTNVAWGTPVAQVNEYAAFIDLFYSLSFTFTYGASDVVTISPYAPHCLFASDFQIGGTYQWRNVSGTAFHLDNITASRNYDESFPGVAEGSGTAATFAFTTSSTKQLDMSTGPGGSLSSSGTLTVVGKTRIRLQRKPQSTWGLAPLGDAQNLPQLTVRMGQVIGNDPTVNLMASTLGTSTCVLASTGTVVGIYGCLKEQNLPAGVPAVNPVVGYATQVYDTLISNQVTTGAIFPYWLQQPGLYAKAIGICYDTDPAAADFKSGFGPDYVAVGPSSKVNEAWTTFQSADNTILSYFDQCQRQYGRYLPDGVAIVADNENGVVSPELSPIDNPQLGYVTGDADLAAANGLAPVPNYYAFVRQSTDPGANPRVRFYEFLMAPTGGY